MRMEKFFRLLTCFWVMTLLQFSHALCAVAATAVQPEIPVKGVVIDAENNPVAGAYIVEKRTGKGTMADSEGRFMIEVQAGSALEISCVGFAPQLIPAGPDMRIVLVQDSLFLDETVVVGYGTHVPPAMRSALRRLLQPVSAPANQMKEVTYWGDADSKTRKLMASCTAEIVNVLKNHKCVAAWEFGNEFNLAADLPGPEHPEISASSIGAACQDFAETVGSLDGHGRLICSGNSVMRNAQWHLANAGSWSNDSFREYAEITGVMTPEPVKGMSEHIYEESRIFSDLGTVNRTWQLIRAKQAAASLGKVYYVGEFTGPRTANGDSLVVKRHYSAYFSQRIQLSLIWNYALRGDIEWSFKAGTGEGDMAFGLMRRYNGKFKAMPTQ